VRPPRFLKFDDALAAAQRRASATGRSYYVFAQSEHPLDHFVVSLYPEPCEGSKLLREVRP